MALSSELTRLYALLETAQQGYADALAAGASELTFGDGRTQRVYTPTQWRKQIEEIENDIRKRILKENDMSIFDARVKT